MDSNSHSMDNCSCVGDGNMDNLNHGPGQDQDQDYHKQLGDYMEQLPKISPPTNQIISICGIKANNYVVNFLVL